MTDAVSPDAVIWDILILYIIGRLIPVWAIWEMATRSVDVRITIYPHISSIDNRDIGIVDFGPWYDLHPIINEVEWEVDT